MTVYSFSFTYTKKTVCVSIHTQTLFVFCKKKNTMILILVILAAVLCVSNAHCIAKNGTIETERHNGIVQISVLDLKWQEFPVYVRVEAVQTPGDFAYITGHIMASDKVCHYDCGFTGCASSAFGANMKYCTEEGMQDIVVSLKCGNMFEKCSFNIHVLFCTQGEQEHKLTVKLLDDPEFYPVKIKDEVDLPDLPN